MNTAKIKQILERCAKRIVEIEGNPESEDRQAENRSSGLPTIHWGVIVDQELVEARIQAFHDIVEVSEDSGVWGVSSVDDAVWSFTKRIVDLVHEKRHSEIRAVVNQVVGDFGKEPSKWVVDILIYGIEPACAGIQFGKILFVTEDVVSCTNIDEQIKDFPRGAQILARLEIFAIDQASAKERAEITLDDHLMVLNAICVHGVPSLIQVSRSNNLERSYSAYRASGSIASLDRMHAVGHNLKRPLLAQELHYYSNQNVGRRVSDMLASPETEFNMRVLRGFQFAGAGCVDAHPERSFLMLAIALESSVLGKSTKSELTYQLGTRVAHLIGNGLNGRKLIAKTVTELYDRRSTIVHLGEYGVSRREAALMQYYCLTALSMLAAAPTFRNFKSSAELEAWFKDRILEGPNHIQAAEQRSAH